MAIFLLGWQINGSRLAPALLNIIKKSKKQVRRKHQKKKAAEAAFFNHSK